ncbi:MAG TPA: phospho-sugar mutase [Myxococcales bacterium]
MDAALAQKIASWIAQDPDPVTRAELQALLDKKADAELADRFSGVLEFGTAGLRGVLGGGPMRMNRAVVRRATAGLAAYVKKTVKDAARRGVVLGYDGRKMSREFAEEAASTLAGAGIVVHLSDTLCPTPMVAFSVLDTGAAAGVMVTASHNPPEYNGYKVYWDNGAQIIPPHDKGISADIDAVGDLRQLPMPSLAEAKSKGLLKSIGTEMEKRYLASIKKLELHPEVKRDVGIVYTAMHGVGGKLAREGLQRAGFTKVWPVTSQLEPDGNFPTVRFPNPEEKGAMDLSLALAREKDADLVIANDPDADRLAIAAKKGPGEYLQLSGDQVGALLGYYLLTERQGGPDRLVVTTIVSSSLLGEMARSLGVKYAETLTGFKWIANQAIAIEAKTPTEFVMGYEEALGYTIGVGVRDKDGISAAAVFAELAAVCKARGHSVLHYLEEIYRRFGLFRSAQHSIVLPGSTGAAEIQKMMARLRANPPKTIGVTAVSAMRDLSRSIRVTAQGEQKVDLPKSDVLTFELEGGGRITARPSGTEPKIKFYFELREPIAPNESFEAAQARADVRMKALIEAFVKIAQP